LIAVLFVIGMLASLKASFTISTESLNLNNTLLMPFNWWRIERGIFVEGDTIIMLFSSDSSGRFEV